MPGGPGGVMVAGCHWGPGLDTCACLPTPGGLAQNPFLEGFSEGASWATCVRGVHLCVCTRVCKHVYACTPLVVPVWGLHVLSLARPGSPAFLAAQAFGFPVPLTRE